MDCLLQKYYIMQSTKNATERRFKLSTDFYDICTLKMVKKTLGSYSYIVSAFLLFLKKNLEPNPYFAQTANLFIKVTSRCWDGEKKTWDN